MRVAIEKKAPKAKTCKNPACRASFVPQRLGQAVCSPKCALATVEVQKVKARKSLALAERREIKVRKEVPRRSHPGSPAGVQRLHSCKRPGRWPPVHLQRQAIGLERQRSGCRPLSQRRLRSSLALR